MVRVVPRRILEAEERRESYEGSSCKAIRIIPAVPPSTWSSKSVSCARMSVAHLQVGMMLTKISMFDEQKRFALAAFTANESCQGQGATPITPAAGRSGIVSEVQGVDKDLKSFVRRSGLHKMETVLQHRLFHICWDMPLHTERLLSPRSMRSGQGLVDRVEVDCGLI